MVVWCNFTSTHLRTTLVSGLQPGPWLDPDTLLGKLRRLVTAVPGEQSLVMRDDRVPFRDFHPWGFALMCVKQFKSLSGSAGKFGAIEHVVLGILLDILIRRENLDVFNTDKFKNTEGLLYVSQLSCGQGGSNQQRHSLC